MRDTKLLWAFIRSILILCAVSTTMGVGIWVITESIRSGIAAFIITLIGQLSINSIVSTLADKRNKEAEFLAAQVLQEAADRQMPYDLNCAYCNTMNRVGINFNSEVIFDCVSCQQPNKVYIQFSTVRITTPLSTSEKILPPIDMDTGVSQSTINAPIKMNEP